MDVYCQKKARKNGVRILRLLLLTPVIICKRTRLPLPIEEMNNGPVENTSTRIHRMSDLLL